MIASYDIKSGEGIEKDISVYQSEETRNNTKTFRKRPTYFDIERRNESLILKNRNGLLRGEHISFFNIPGWDNSP